MALVEALLELDHTTRAAKQIARCTKMAHKQAKSVVELWQASENQIIELG